MNRPLLLQCTVRFGHEAHYWQGGDNHMHMCNGVAEPTTRESIASALDGLAAEFEATKAEWRETSDDMRTPSGLGHAIREMRKRAAELRNGER